VQRDASPPLHDQRLLSAHLIKESGGQSVNGLRQIRAPHNVMENDAVAT
jgi:hypothetical protein